MSQQTTALQALMHLLKGYIGTGVLAMPKAFSYSGIIIGCIGTPFIGFLCHCCIHMLIDINDHLCQKLGLDSLDFEELAEKALSEGPKQFRKYSKLSRFIVTFFLFLAQMGFCCAYYLFISDNIRQFFINLNISDESMSVQTYLLITLPFMIIISFIKNIKHLSIASMFANITILASFVIIVYNLLTNFNQNVSISNRKLLGNKLPEFFSTTMFTYEGITVTMALYKSMKNRQNFAKPFGVINVAIVIVISLYTIIGFLGYLKYGEEVEASITLMLPNQPLYTSVLFVYSLAISVSYAVQLYVAIHLIWPFIENALQEYKLKNISINITNYTFRAILVIFTYALAALIPRLDLILSLIGAISCSTVAIMIPPILHTITFWEIRTKTLSRIWLCSRNGLIFVFGIVGFVTGTYFGLNDIITLL